MLRVAFIAVLATLLLVFGLSIVASLYDVSGTPAYAQGPLGRKTGGEDAEERRREEEAQKQEDAKRQEEARRQEATRRQEEERRRREAAEREESQRRLEESRRQDEQRQREQAERLEQERTQEESRRQEEARRQEEQRRVEEARRQDETRRQEEARREEERRQAESARNRVPDATPTYRRDDRRERDTGEFDRVGERPDRRHRRGRHTYHPEYYPYDPPYVVVVEQDPVIIIHEPGPIAVPPPPAPPEAPEPETPAIPPVPPTPPGGADEVFPPAQEDYFPPSQGGTEGGIVSTADDALDLIKRAWLDRNPKLLDGLMPDEQPIKILKDGEHSHDLPASEFYSLTTDAITDLSTKVFWLEPVNKTDSKVTATGVHTYRGADGVIRRSDVAYTLELRDGRWVIAETSFTPAVVKPADESAVDGEDVAGLMVRLVPAFMPDPAISVAAVMALRF